MELLYELQDDQYPFEYIDHTRICARGVVLDEHNRVALSKLLFTDIFGKRDYFELPGGGQQLGETIETCFYREMEEELGYQTELLTPIGEVSDYYNLIHRHNRNFYFLARRKDFIGQRLEPKELVWIERIIWVPLDEAIALYEAMDDHLISGLVKSRELPILKLARSMVNGY